MGPGRAACRRRRAGPADRRRKDAVISHVTTHVLDTGTGRPAVGVAVTLLDAGGSEVATGVTDADGRVRVLGPIALVPGTYRLRFATGAYYAERRQVTFFPEVEVAFFLDEGHAHVPLLLSPFAHSTYRGS